MVDIIVWLLVGAIAGWLAGKIVQGHGFGLLGNIAVGVVGAVIGGYLFSFLGLSANGFIGSIVTAVAGAVVLLFVIGLVKR